ncbi:MAG: RNA polymerase sigma factor [Bacteroidales bacterium]|nr:RNA polymerase sigma factor [Bacteroidales bacterium]
MDNDIAHIVKLCRLHNPKGQRALYSLFAAEMLGVCRRYAPDRATAEDLLQEGFIRVFAKLHNLREPQAAESWIYRIMVSTCVNYLNRQYRRYESVDDLPDTDSEPAFDADPFAAEELIKAIGTLTPGQRLVFNLREVEGYSFAEIAAMLAAPEGTVRSLLSRAKHSLRQQLSQNQ